MKGTLFWHASTICWRHFEQIAHRRKLFAFIILTPFMLMLLFGLAFGNQTLPSVDPSQLEQAINEIRADPLLGSVVKIYETWKADSLADYRILVGEFASPTVSGSTAWLFVVPSYTVAVVFVDNGQFYFVDFWPNGTLRALGLGPVPPPIDVDFNDLSTLDLRPLISEDTGWRALEILRRVFGISLELLSAKRVRTIDLLFPEIIGIQLGWSGVLGAAALSIEDRVAGSRKRMLLSPIRRAAFFLGNAWANFILVGLQLTILLFMGAVVFQVQFKGSPLEIAAILSLTAAALIGIGLIISHLSKTADEVFYFTTLVNLPMMFFSSRILPVQDSPISQFLRAWFPTTYSNEALSHIMISGGHLGDLTGAIGTLAIMAILLYTAGTYFLSRERET